MNNTFILKILRGSPGKQYWEEFELEIKPMQNVISSLMEIQKNPVNIKGEVVDPVAWEQGCLEEVCGSCSMLINGVPRQACSALIKKIVKETGSNIITLSPFSKFPLIRDLVVSRDRMFENLKKIQGWIEIDSTHDLGPGPKISSSLQELRYTLSTCMTCGCCLEGCPQVNDHSPFIGPAAIGQVSLMNLHPIGKQKKKERIHTMMEKGGVADCGMAQNCREVCPKKIPLTEAIADISRQTTIQALKDKFNNDWRE